jgi:predicted membrane channel-forming protein YqfA (hemolysin III family)
VSHEGPPNNPLKLPTYVLLALLGVVLVVSGVSDPSGGAWILVVFGVLTLVPCVLAIRAIAQHRNPRWIRSPLDEQRPAGTRR